MTAHMKLKFKEDSSNTLKGIEIAHYCDERLKIFSRHRWVVIDSVLGKTRLQLPFTKFDIFGFSRILRRALRLDKCNIFPLDSYGDSLLIIRQGKLYKYTNKVGFQEKLKLKLARNLLHNALCITRSGRLIIAEYGANFTHAPIPIYASDDNGDSWSVVYEIPAGKAKHAHNVYYDKITDKIWVFTGDDNGECWVIVADESFSRVDYLGDGSQKFRACTAFFTAEKVVWAMDSPIETSCLVHLNRKNLNIELVNPLPGPVWYGKAINSVGYLIATSVEPGNSVSEDHASIYFSSDLISWTRIAEYKKDKWPMSLFKYGVIGFSQGNNSDNSFFIFGEALKNLDGKVMQCTLKRI